MTEQIQSEQTQTDRKPRMHSTLSEYATKPTGVTLFLRTFIPWQIIRFLIINTRIMWMTVRNEKLQ